MFALWGCELESRTFCTNCCAAEPQESFSSFLPSLVSVSKQDVHKFLWGWSAGGTDKLNGLIPPDSVAKAAGSRIASLLCHGGFCCSSQADFSFGWCLASFGRGNLC